MSTPNKTDTVRKFITPIRRYGLARLIKKTPDVNPSTPPSKDVSERTHTHSSPATPNKTCITPVRRLGLSHPKKKSDPPDEVSVKNSSNPKLMDNLSVEIVRLSNDEIPTQSPVRNRNKPNISPYFDKNELQDVESSRQSSNEQIEATPDKRIFSETPKKCTTKTRKSSPDPKTTMESALTVVTADVHESADDSDSDDEPLIIYKRRSVTEPASNSCGSYQQASTRTLWSDSDDDFVPPNSSKKRRKTTTSSFKKSKTESENASSNFSTEDFLSEFNKDPQSFKKSLGLDDNPCDDKTDIIKKIEKISHVTKDKDDYIAVLCEVSTLESVNSNSRLDSDDDFTSDAEAEPKQRESLLKKIQLLEGEVKKKEAKLEVLERAQIYKNVHSPLKIQRSTEAWMEGCRSGLGDLLLKLQEQGCIDMDLLIKQLRVPEQIVKKLNF